MPIDYNHYPKNWKTEIRPKVLDRAKNCCEFCGLQNYAEIHRFGKGINDWEYWPKGIQGEFWGLMNLKKTKIILTIAHLDHDKTNHEISIDRLKALCQKCHLSYDMARHIENRKKNRSKHQYKLQL